MTSKDNIKGLVSLKFLRPCQQPILPRPPSCLSMGWVAYRSALHIRQICAYGHTLYIRTLRMCARSLGCCGAIQRLTENSMRVDLQIIYKGWVGGFGRRVGGPERIKHRCLTQHAWFGHFIPFFWEFPFSFLNKLNCTHFYLQRSKHCFEIFVSRSFYKMYPSLLDGNKWIKENKLGKFNHDSTQR